MMECASVFALVVLGAVWIGAETTVGTKLILTGILLAIWLPGLLWAPIYIALPFYGGVVYFVYFGSEPGRRWRP